jgi:hypothetical protein
MTQDQPRAPRPNDQPRATRRDGQHERSGPLALQPVDYGTGPGGDWTSQAMDRVVNQSQNVDTQILEKLEELQRQIQRIQDDVTQRKNRWL